VSRPPVAIAHDYLTQHGGAERVVLAMLRAFPEATVHTLLYEPDATFPEFRDAHIVTSPLNRIGAVRRDHRLGLPLLASAASRLEVDADVTLVSTSGWAHGFDIQGRSLVYCYNPARWLYQAHDYLGSEGIPSAKGLALRCLAPGLRRWDRRAAARGDRYLAISSVVRDRIKATYGIDADVVFPPTTVHPGEGQRPVGPFDPGFHLLVSRLLPYKNVDKAIEAFRRLPEERLVVIGRGPEEERLRATLPDNVAILADVTDDELRWAYAHCTALIAPSLEDYGLTPLEAGAFGKPTLALRAGGYLDTVAEGVTGLFFDRADAASIAEVVLADKQGSWDGDAIVKHGQRFDEITFRAAITAAADDLLSAGGASRR
jgi:glycosyltransferase involved in cell wall biosynthesis